MKLIVGGCRGTSPVAQPEFMKYGGETTSFLIEGARGERVLIDAGSGVRVLGQRLEKEKKSSSLLMLFTHYHLDHVSGLPSLAPIYSSRWSIEMASPKRGGFLVGEVIPRVMHKPFWPLQVEDLKSRIQFTTLRGTGSASPRTFGGLEIRWCPLNHPGGSTAYRIDERSSDTSVVIATDIEWAASDGEERAQLLQLCTSPSPVSLLVMDGQYADAEYPKFKGWGHSTWQETVKVAKQCGVQRLLVSHHSPLRCDDELDALEKEVRRAMPAAALARGLMELVVGVP